MPFVLRSMNGTPVIARGTADLFRFASPPAPLIRLITSNTVRPFPYLPNMWLTQTLLKLARDRCERQAHRVALMSRAAMYVAIQLGCRPHAR